MREVLCAKYGRPSLTPGIYSPAPGWCLPVTQFLGRGLSLVSMVSINLGIWLYRVEKGDTGESIEPGESH